jgi:hypothetical protein
MAIRPRFIGVRKTQLSQLTGNTASQFSAQKRCFTIGQEFILGFERIFDLGARLGT